MEDVMATNANDAVGMPQLDFSTFPNQIFWLVVTLVVLYLILSRVALPRIGSILAERSGTITADIDAAETYKRQASEAEAAYNKALEDARAQAHKIVEEMRADIQADLDVAIQKADAEIAARTAESERRIAEIRDSANEAVEEVARDAAREILALFGVKAEDKAINDSGFGARERRCGMIRLAAILLAASATPALAAGDYPFFSLRNTDLIVLFGFVIFVGILVYYKVPAMITGLLDKRAEDIRGELAEARRLREEAQEVRASFERKKSEVKEQAERIVAKAKTDAELAAATGAGRSGSVDQAPPQGGRGSDRLGRGRGAAGGAQPCGSGGRCRLGRTDRANMGKADANRLIEDSIKTVEARLH
jgi:F-type H+-transporting ATPase subunit b